MRLVIDLDLSAAVDDEPGEPGEGFAISAPLSTEARAFLRGRRKASAPLTTWTAIAAVLGVSVDTIERRRRERGDETRPWFASPRSAREWYKALQAPAPAPEPDRPTRRRAPRTRTAGAAVDWKAIARGDDGSS